MKALVIYCHPNADSFAAAVRDVVTDGLTRKGAEVRVRDLYAEGFAPVLTEAELGGYLDEASNRAPVADHVADVEWCDALIFVYPTWWYGLPAMLKGWLDRVLLPGVAFRMPPPEGGAIAPNMTHIRTLAVYTTGGASRWLTALIGAPGKRTILRGVRTCCAPRCRTSFAMHYLMDGARRESLEAHLRTVAKRVAAL